jgi:hypothetical protein
VDRLSPRSHPRRWPLSCNNDCPWSARNGSMNWNRGGPRPRCRPQPNVEAVSWGAQDDHRAEIGVDRYLVRHDPVNNQSTCSAARAAMIAALPQTADTRALTRSAPEQEFLFAEPLLAMLTIRSLHGLISLNDKQWRKLTTYQKACLEHYCGV